MGCRNNGPSEQWVVGIIGCRKNGMLPYRINESMMRNSREYVMQFPNNIIRIYNIRQFSYDSRIHSTSDWNVPVKPKQDIFPI